MNIFRKSKNKISVNQVAIGDNNIQSASTIILDDKLEKKCELCENQLRDKKGNIHCYGYVPYSCIKAEKEMKGKMKIKEVFDDMRKVLDSYGTDEYTKEYKEDGYELVVTIRKAED